MRLCFASRRPVFPFVLGGAERSLFELGLSLSRYGFEILLIGQLSSNELRRNYHNLEKSNYASRVKNNFETIRNTSFPREYSIRIDFNEKFISESTLLADWEQFLHQKIVSFQPDCLLCHLDGSLQVLLAGERENIPVIHFIRDTFNPLNLLPYTSSEKFTRPPACTISNSKFTAEWFYNNTRMESEVVYPIVKQQTPSFRENKEVESILYVNPSAYKGENLAFNLTTHFERIKFILAPSWGRDFSNKWSTLKNVEIIPNTTVLEELYGSADLVIVPTQGEEAFGRVGIEAQTFGIPVIASKHSGLTESLGDSALLVENYESTGAWISALTEMINDRELRTSLVEKGYQNISKYARDSVSSKMKDIIEGVVNRRDLQ